MSKYCRKPVVIEAHQWWKNGDHPDDGDPGTEGEVVRYFRHPWISGDSDCAVCGVRMHDHGWIDTLEGDYRVCPGDYIVTEFKGEYYPVRPGIFTAMYDLLD